jgi:hypothetical protein
MDASKHVGRVGALAVALGIGTALTTGTGVAWADDGGNDTGKSSSTDGKTTGADNSAPTRKGPLAKVGDRIRKDLEAGLGEAGNALKRSQTRLNTPSTRDNPRTKIKAKIQGTLDGVTTAVENVTKSARPEAPKVLAPRASSEKSGTTRIAPEDPGTVPHLYRPQSPNTVVVKLNDATATGVQPNVDATGTDGIAPAPTKITRAITAPVTPAAIRPSAPVETPRLTAQPVMSALLAAAGVSQLGAGASPTAPGPSPALWTVMAWARREFERTINPNGTARLVSANDAASVAAVSGIQPTAAVTPTAAVGPNQLTPKPAAPQVGQTTSVGWVTGNSTAPWYVGGTDLGIMWDNGAGKILTIFGDTFNDRAMTTGWRNNVLLRTGDKNLSNGLQFDEGVVTPGGTGPGTNYAANTYWGPGAGYQNGLGAGPIGAAQVILANPAFNGLLGKTITMIPTSAISVTQGDQTTQYVTVMAVKSWGAPGSWTTNYSAIASSTDGGAHWTVNPGTVRSGGFLRTNQSFVAGNQNFQQNALVYGNADDPNSWTGGTVGQGERYVYVYGTPSGRHGAAYVARVPESDVTNLKDYEYWSATANRGWVKGAPSAATPVIGPRNVSEMSVQYNEYLGKYVVLYTDGGNNVVMRVSDSAQGTWSDPTVLVANKPLVTDPVLRTAQSGMYAPMIHPWSGTDQLGAGNEQYLYYDLSYWGAYNVALKQTDLSAAKILYV